MRVTFTMEVRNPVVARKIKVVAEPSASYLLVTDEKDNLTALSDYEVNQVVAEVIKRTAN